MSFDRDALAAAIDEHGAIARVVVADAAGSIPRETGTAMLIWKGGQSGTIGGGALEFEAARRARAALSQRKDTIDHLPLGPAMGQCCGGHVSLLTEVWTSDRLAKIETDVVARPTPGTDPTPPLDVQRVLADARAQGAPPVPGLVGGWMIEPVLRSACELWIYGAGHVGRALVSVLAPLPDIAITWIDTSLGRFPDDIPDRVIRLVAANPADVVHHAPNAAHHLILTYSHALDLELCNRVLRRDFGSVGLIGSKTKWARFRRRLRALGHGEDRIGRIACPIGEPVLGKHPQAIAIGVAREVISKANSRALFESGHPKPSRIRN